MRIYFTMSIAQTKEHLGKQNPTAKSKIKRKISLYHGTNGKVFQSVNAMYSKILQRIP